MRAELSRAVCTALKNIRDIKLPMFALPETLCVTFHDARSAEKQCAILQTAICAPQIKHYF